MVLRVLEVHLHRLIRKSIPNPDACVLPRLEPLVEFDSAAMWFPLHPEVLNDATRMGVMITLLTHLDETELEVELKWRKLKYQISVQGVEPIGGYR